MIRSDQPQEVESLASSAAFLRWLRARVPATFAGWASLGLAGVSVAFLVAMVVRVLSPIFQELETWGGHDWDHMALHRYLMVKTVRAYHEVPWWNPYGCGGHTEWGAFDGGTALVSPWCLLYLVAKLPLALRCEVAGTAVLSAIGTWVLAGRFTTSAGLRAFVCAVFVVNGRWALQATSGHTWHLYYLWLPWTLLFFERARVTRQRTCDDPLPLSPAARRRNIVYLGGCIAMMVYTGAIYPLPHAIFILGLYCMLLAVVERDVGPVRVALLGGLVGLVLSAPKLLPVIDTLSKYPRLVDSTETLDVAAFFTLLTAPDQDMGSRLANVSQWGWHEWGMYIGWGPVIFIGLATLMSRRAMFAPLRWVGVITLILGFGAFWKYAPWPLLHELPIFKSQHVPSRWMYPAVLILGLLAVASTERLLRRVGKARLLAELVLVGLAGYVALDIADAARVPMKHAFWMRMPEIAQRTTGFYQEQRVPPALQYAVDDYAPPNLPAAIANVGVIESVSFAGLNIWAPRDARGKTIGLGAKGRGEKEYRGEVFMAQGKGTAQIVNWTPTRVQVEVDGAEKGDVLVMNQNFDPGWRADGNLVMNHEDTIATTVGSPHAIVTFRYVPRYLYTGLAIFVAGIAAIVTWLRMAQVPHRLATAAITKR